MGCTIIGCGKQLPALDVPNEELTKLVDTSDEWISTRTGILSRRVCVSEGNIDLAEGAARQALGWADGGYSERKIAPEDIDLIIYSTITPDEVVPTCAAMLRRRLGLVNAAAFDMNAACSGFIYGLTIAETMMAASAPGAAGAAGRNPIRRALVVGGERLTRIVDWNDRNTCVLFGDGAGAAVVERDERKPGILSWYIKNDDDDSNALTCPSAYDAPPTLHARGHRCGRSATGRPRHRPHRRRARCHGTRCRRGAAPGPVHERPEGVQVRHRRHARRHRGGAAPREPDHR